MHTDTPLPDLARELGIGSDALRAWLRRNASDTTRPVARRSGGKLLLVTPEGCEAARRHYAGGRDQADADGRGPMRRDESERVQTDAPDVRTDTAEWPQELAERLAVLTARAEVAEARMGDVAAEVTRLRAKLASELQARMASEVREGRAADRLAAWREWGRLVTAALARWRRWRRVPVLPPAPDLGESPRLRG